MVNASTPSATTSLADLASRFAELRGLAASRTPTPPSKGASLDAARADAATIADQIDQVQSFSGSARFRTLNFRVEAPDLSVVESVTGSAKLVEPPEFDVNLDITASAQIAGFLLSFGGPSINLGGAGASDGASDQFVVNVTGPRGSAQLSFASGTALGDMASQINSFTSATGVHAVFNGQGALRLESTDVGSDQFVSVHVIDDGYINGSGGIYRFDPTDTNAIDTNTAPVAFYNAYNQVTDHGQDVAATVNGKAATGAGNAISYATTRYTFTIQLTQAAAQTLGSKYAFHFNASKPRPQATDGPLDATPFLPDTYA